MWERAPAAMPFDAFAQPSRDNALMASLELPITPLLPEIVASLAAHPRLVLEAPPGAG